MSPKFNPIKYMAPCCKTIIYSRYPGEFVSCFCGENFVDQTEYYTRATEGVEPLEGEIERVQSEALEVIGEDYED